MYKDLKTQAGFKPGIFCSVGGRDDQYATPGQTWELTSTTAYIAEHPPTF
jgi:hypothetical protein